MKNNIRLINGDALKIMDDLIKEGIVVDCVLTDPPYGTTACKWDSVIPFEPMWERLNKLIKPNGAIVLFGSEPFSSALRMSNIKNYKYDWVWEKSKATGFLNSKRMPLIAIELISIFYKRPPTYNPQKTKGKPYNKGTAYRPTDVYGKQTQTSIKSDGERLPRNIIYFRTAESEGKLHPTQKPVALGQYLIRTYTNEGETILDFTAGSFTTAIACLNTKRNFIGIEKDKKYFEIGKNRVEEHIKTLDFTPVIVYNQSY